MEKEFNKFISECKSKFEMYGDLGWFNSLIFDIDDDNFYQLGLDTENENILCLCFNGDLIKSSENVKDLQTFLDIINKHK